MSDATTGMTTAEKLAYLMGLRHGGGGGVSAVNGRTGSVTVREVPDHGITGQVLTVTGEENYDWQSLPVWDGTID